MFDRDTLPWKRGASEAEGLDGIEQLRAFIVVFARDRVLSLFYSGLPTTKVNVRAFESDKSSERGSK